MERTLVTWPNGMQFIQTPAYLGVTTDCALLAAFANPARCRRAADLGCGIGAAGLLLAHRAPKLTVVLLDIQRGAVDLARDNVFLNGLEDRVTTRCGDLRKAPLPADSFDLVLCNPPYFPAGAGSRARGAGRAAARSDETCTIDEVCAAASRLLRCGGRLAVVFRPERLADLICAMRGHRLEPKRLRRVLERPGAAPSLILAEAVKDGGVSLAFDPDLVLRNRDESYSEELNDLYRTM